MWRIIPAQKAGAVHQGAWAARNANMLHVGDIIVVSVKEAIPRGRVKKGDVLRRLLLSAPPKTLSAVLTVQRHAVRFATRPFW